MRRISPVVLSGLLLSLTSLGCSQNSPETTRQPTSDLSGPPAIPVQSAGTAAQSPGRFPETFETAQKGAYATGDENLASGSWHFEDALIGSSDQDHKNGQQAARLRDQGRLRMNFDAPRGVQVIKVTSAAYGTDPASTWELWGSIDGGRTYRRIGQPVKAQGPRLVVTTFQGGAAGPLRLEIRKTDGGKGRLNIDDITLTGANGANVAGGSVVGAPSTTAPASSPAPTSSSLPPATTARASAVVSGRDDNMALGNPSGATPDVNNPSNYLLVKPQYVVGYNAQRGTPTWVSWHLNRAWMGSAPRQDDFRPDPALPRQFYQVTPRSYSGSGFDRGHNCPSADRSTDLDDNSATFLMTNMIPQAGNNNQRTWSGLEEWTRNQVKQGQEVYVLMGSYGKGGTGQNGRVTTIDQGRVTVPARVWKVLVILPEGSNDLQRIASGQARILAVDTPNDQSVSPEWSQYRVSVDAIEAATGLDLLSKLPLPMQDKLEAQVDTGSVR
ncbi:DNA/RNA non-specific endonuclease [Hymenobacter fodinae]|uniref:DNA/RNA non-specific endonuclease n=1 Tax=Hymenobacter fodinae TaxID=2510796 RepID=A0A4Z0P0M0_9BACT|nr:DNA/RNA non-specific endonuclease [Hymenobacter fodinae]TGE04086.1 DNA/RNA non-specific endonuclease [Hymenobacter fodinae]